MAGGLLNLVANGNENIILNGNPTKTFFKAKYSKYTNFGMQKFRIDYEGLRTLRYAEESHFQFKVPRYGDLLMNSFLVVTLPTIWSPIYPPQGAEDVWAGYDFKWIDNIGCEMIKEISVTCGGQTLQKFNGSYIKNIVKRDYDEKKQRLFDKMTGHETNLNDPANADGRVNAYPNAYYTTSEQGAHPSIDGKKLYIPLNSWFMNSSKIAFPLIALQYAEIYINVTLRPIYELYRIRDVTDKENLFPYIQPDLVSDYMQFFRFINTPPSRELRTNDYNDKRVVWNADVHILSTYAFISDAEQKMFADTEHKYLFKDVHTHIFKNITGSRRLELETTGLVSSWMFYFQRSDVNLRNEWSNYTNWPYNWVPFNIDVPPIEDGYKYDGYDNNTTYFESFYKSGFGPAVNPNNTASSLMINGDYHVENKKRIITDFGILFDGNYREKNMNSEIFSFIEPFNSSQGSTDCDNLYHYNFCITTNNKDYQPNGAINLTKFNKIELEFSTISPPLDASAQVLTICDDDGNVIGINKPTWNMYKYNYDMVVFEEKYNIITVTNGNCGIMYAR
jgi:hypothetical protein